MIVSDTILQLLGFTIILFMFGFVFLGLHLSAQFQKRFKLRAIRRQYMVDSNPVDLFKRP